jgi:excisionase family DNA binding protein
MDDEILTVEEVAERFNVSAQTIRESWIASGKLKAGRIGRRYAIRASDVEAMLDEAVERQTPNKDLFSDPGERLARAENADTPAHVWDSEDAGGELIHGTPD